MDPGVAWSACLRAGTLAGRLAQQRQPDGWQEKSPQNARQRRSAQDALCANLA